MDYKAQAKADAMHAYKTNSLYVPPRWYENYEINREYENYFHMWLNYFLKEGVE